MTPSKALTVLGLGSVAIGFAFKDIFENFFAGILILWRYPFDRGDFISCVDVSGKVEEITIRNTLIRRLDGELAVVPNATVFKNNVDVLTSQPQRRVRLICGIAYGEDVDTARDVIQTAVRKCKTIEGIRTVEVFAEEFADSSVNFEVAWWTGSKPLDMRRSRDEVVTAIKAALDSAGIEIPFPYRTLTFKDASIPAALGGASHRNLKSHEQS
jgi:small-conductance mechanosensitive channel